MKYNIIKYTRYVLKYVCLYLKIHALRRRTKVHVLFVFKIIKRRDPPPCIILQNFIPGVRVPEVDRVVLLVMVVACAEHGFN